MIQKLEVTYIPASELEHANLLETVHWCILVILARLFALKHLNHPVTY